MDEPLVCCHPTCLADAEFGIVSEGAPSDTATQACKEHIGDMLEPGVSQVWPLS